MPHIAEFLISAFAFLAAGGLCFWAISEVTIYNQELHKEEEILNQYDLKRAKSGWGQMTPFLLAWVRAITAIPMAGTLMQSLGERHDKMLAWANHPGGLNGIRFEALKQLSALIGFLAFYVGLGSDYMTFCVAAGIGSYMLPNLKIWDLVQKSKAAIARDLPDAMDTFALMVGAGQEFMNAIDTYLNNARDGRLKEELLILKNELRLGRTRSQALANMAHRVDVPSVTDFVRSIIQAERTGASLSETLAAQADDLRTKRFQQAEEEGQKATVRLLMPLLGLILPACMLVLFGPVAINYFGAR